MTSLWKARGAALGAALVLSLSAGAQTPSQGEAKDPGKPAEPKKDDFSISVGSTIFADFTYTDVPQIKDADGNSVRKSEFEVRRAYINVTGKVNDFIAFRVTPDIAGREVTTGATNSYDGSLVFRLKYAFVQFNLDKVTKGSWIRFGQNPTPYLDLWDALYRYRFQGTSFTERNGYLGSSDVGVSARYNFKGDYGDIHAGFYNGDTYSKAEVNDQKALQVRLTLRPAPKSKDAKGLRVTAFYDLDHPVKGADRMRLIGSASFEHQLVNAGFEYIDAKDNSSASKPVVSSNGWSVFATPKFPHGFEALLRYDWTRPDKSVDGTKKLLLAGASYWFKTMKPNLQAAVMTDFENVKYGAALNKPEEKRFEVKTLLTF